MTRASTPNRPAIVTLVLLQAVLLPLLGGATAQPDVIASLELVELDLSIEIRDSIALTAVSLTARNPDIVAHERVLQIPLTPSAVLTNFTLTTQNETLVGVVKEKNQAQQAYNASVTRGESAALLGSAGHGLLSLNVNVAAGSNVTLRAVFVDVLPIHEGVQSYAFPFAGLASAYGEADTFRLTLAMTSEHGWDAVEFAGVALDPATESSMSLERAFSATDMLPSQAFVVNATPTRLAYTSMAAISRLDGMASLVFGLLPPEDGGAGVPKDLVLIVDRSGSMAGDKIVQAKEALAAIVDQLPATDRLALVSFSGDVTPRAGGLRPVDASARASARAWVSDLVADGSTNIEGALREGLSILGPEPTRVPMIVLITDGQPTAGITDPADIIASVGEHNLADVRIHVVGIGMDRDDRFLGRLAEANRGFYAPITDLGTVADSLEDFYAQISTTLLKDVSVSFENLEVVDVYPNPLPDVYAGSHLLLAGRANASLLPAEVLVHISGQSPGGQVGLDLRINASALVPRPEADRLWARQKADSIERSLQLEDDAAVREELVQELRRLGVAHQIETTQTSWVIARELELPAPSPGETAADASYWMTNQGMPAATPPAAPPAAPPPLMVDPNAASGAPDYQDSAGAGSGAASKTPGLGVLLAVCAALAALVVVRRR